MTLTDLPLPGTTTVRGACPCDCPDTCALEVTVEDGRATRVRGDRSHPFTRGGLCVKMNDYEKTVHSSDRVLYPMRRTGPKGSGRFERISWDAALDEIAARFTRISETVGPEAIMPVSYLGTQGILNGLNVGDPFFNRLGATISERTYCDSGSCTAYAMTVGATAGVDPEALAHARYIVIWANNMLSTNLHLWPFVADAQRRGAKVVVIDPIRHRTARHADWYIPIRPGTDGALALAMMHVIITEGLTDADYVARYTVGYGELADRVRQYTPEWASQETGIPAADIVTLAREYAAASPSVIRIGVAIERHAGGGQTVRAISCLPALTGAWRHPGGGLLQLPLWAFPVNWPAFLGAEMITPGTRVVNQFLLGQALTGELELDPPIQALMVYNSNPLVVCPEQDKLIAGLAREDLFTVVSEHFMTDTADYADIVLPATTQLEQRDVMFSWGHFYVTMNNPAIAPLGEAVSNTELFRRLAARMGFTEPSFARTDEEMIAEAFDWSSPVLEGITPKTLERDGWSRLRLPAPELYAPHAEGGFPTPSGKVEFVSSIAAGGNFVLPLFRQGSTEHQSGETVDPLPHYIAPREPADARFPLTLLSPKSHGFLNSSFADRPGQQRVQGGQVVLVHEDDAEARGLVDGQEVVVVNDRGRFAAHLQVTTDVARGVVVSPMGGWRKHAGGATVNAVSPSVFADLGRAPTFSDNRVDVRPV